MHNTVQGTKTAKKAIINDRQIVLLAFGAGLLIISVLLAVLLTSADRPVAGAGGDDGKLGGDFILRSQQGDVALQDFRGKIVILYFGFVSCSEVCPNSMNMWQRALGKMNLTERHQVQPILISVDPARDSVDDLAKFTARFHPQILGLTGTVEEIDKVARDYGAYFEITHSDTPDSEYAFDHVSRYYIVDQQGELVDAMRHGTTANELVARIRALL